MAHNRKVNRQDRSACEANPGHLDSDSLNKGALMVQDLPSIQRSAPDTASARHSSLILHQGIGQQVRVRRQLRAMKATGFPVFVVGLRISLDERIDHGLPAIALTRCADLPEGRVGHILEIAPRRSEFGPVKDRLAPLEFFEHRREPGISYESWFHSAESSHIFINSVTRNSARASHSFNGHANAILLKGCCLSGQGIVRIIPLSLRDLCPLG